MTAVAPLPPAMAARLDRDGYLLLRAAIVPETLEAARAAFDDGVRPSQDWPVGRGGDWRHAMVDRAPAVLAICRSPYLRGAAAQLIGGPFFLAQVEGREPLAGGGQQTLHRDGAGRDKGRAVSALAYLDDYGPDNGATRYVSGSHRDLDLDAVSGRDERVLEGRAGDIFVFDSDLLHGGTRNCSGARRRSLLINFFAEALLSDHLATRTLRAVSLEVEMLEGVAPA